MNITLPLLHLLHQAHVRSFKVKDEKRISKGGKVFETKQKLAKS